MTNLSFKGYEQIIKATAREVTLVDTLRYLYRYGYFTDLLDMSFADVVKQVRKGMPELREALIRFQEFFELDTSGESDPVTQRVMQIPRCACPDILSKAASSDVPAAIKNYQGNGYWPISKMPNGVYYFVDANVPNRKAVIEAADRWNAVCNINLVQTDKRNQANIVITHKMIDGGGGTLALGWFPTQTSPNQTVEQRLDAGEQWGYNFLAEVSTHEFGHNLGWNHKNGQSVMHPFATGQWPKPTAYDIGVAQDYYDKPVVKPEPDPPTTPPPPGEPPTDRNPYREAKLWLPDPTTGKLTEYFIAPVTEYGGI